ncbi:hypothetical protein JG687_00010612 [Phytophthora cactorum]|uniref:Uncharacterized protein n=1 Tax=Phytophthora cactorum TaxID=29920 RepID=A0A8T1U7Z4_9STRA|nr:hypothetical protein JG687_00010612 [Phytophthora cactorum]
MGTIGTQYPEPATLNRRWRHQPFVLQLDQPDRSALGGISYQSRHTRVLHFRPNARERNVDDKSSSRSCGASAPSRSGVVVRGCDMMQAERW